MGKTSMVVEIRVVTSKTIKYVEINLTKEWKDLDTGNHKTLMKEIEGTNENDIPCFWMRRINIGKTPILFPNNPQIQYNLYQNFSDIFHINKTKKS